MPINRDVVSQVTFGDQLTAILPRSIPIAPSYTGRSAIVELSELEVGKWIKGGREGVSDGIEIFINALPHYEKGQKKFRKR